MTLNNEDDRVGPCKFKMKKTLVDENDLSGTNCKI